MCIYRASDVMYSAVSRLQSLLSHVPFHVIVSLRQDVWQHRRFSLWAFFNAASEFMYNKSCYLVLLLCWMCFKVCCWRRGCSKYVIKVLGLSCVLSQTYNLLFQLTERTAVSVNQCVCVCLFQSATWAHFPLTPSATSITFLFPTVCTSPHWHNLLQFYAACPAGRPKFNTVVRFECLCERGCVNLHSLHAAGRAPEPLVTSLYTCLTPSLSCG